MLAKVGFVAAIICCALFVGLPEAAALQYQRVTLEPPNVAIFARGPIVPGDVKDLSVFIHQLPTKDRLVGFLVNSPGGDVAVAEDIAKLISKYRLSVFVPPDSQCSSACFLLFAAAAGRFAAPNAVIGVHSISIAGQETVNSLAATTVMARDLAQDGVPDAIVGKIVTTPPGRATWLTASDFAAMGVRFIDDPRWR